MAGGQVPSSYPLVGRSVLPVWTAEKVLGVPPCTPHIPEPSSLGHWAFKGSPAPGTTGMGTLDFEGT